MRLLTDINFEGSNPTHEGDNAMLEQKIELLTAAVEALTKVISVNVVAAGKEYATAPTIKEKKDGKTTRSEVVEIEDPNEKSQTTSDTSQSSAPESEPVTYDDVKRATNAVSKISRDKAIAGLARFGVASATKLAEAQWPEYVAYMTRVAAGEIDPEASHE
jgi:hypothetical protein